MLWYTILNPIVFMLMLWYEILWELYNKCLYVFLEKVKESTQPTGAGSTEGFKSVFGRIFFYTTV